MGKDKQKMQEHETSRKNTTLPDYDLKRKCHHHPQRKAENDRCKDQL